jgi:hypothetical protein
MIDHTVTIEGGECVPLSVMAKTCGAEAAHFDAKMPSHDWVSGSITLRSGCLYREFALE